MLLGSRSVSCFALRNRAQLKGVISVVALSMEGEQLKLKIPGVCDARHLVFYLFILPLGKSVKNKFLFSMTAQEQWVNCLFKGRTTDLYLVSSGI